MVDRRLEFEGTCLYLLAPMIRGRKGEYRKGIRRTSRRRVSSVKVDGSFYPIEEVPAPTRRSSTTSTSSSTGWIVAGPPARQLS